MSTTISIVEQRRNARFTRFALLVCGVLFIGVLHLLSAPYSRAYSRARSRAESLATHGLTLRGSRFSLYRIDTHQFAPSWEFQFEEPHTIFPPEFVIQVSIAGDVVATRPQNLLQIL